MELGERWYRTQYQDELRALYELLSVSETAFKEQLDSLYVESVQEAARMPQSQRDLFFLSVLGTELKLSIDLPNLLRYSIFAQTYFFFEAKLQVLSNFFYEKKRLKIKPSDLKHRGITRNQFYLKHIAEIAFPDQTAEWKNIKKYNQIRNIISHTAGEVDFIDIDKFNNTIEGLNDIAVEFNGRIRLGEKFCFDTLHTIDRFMKQLFENLDEDDPFWESFPDL